MTRRIDFTGLRTFRPRLHLGNLGQTPGNAKPYQVRWALSVISQYNALSRAGIAPMAYPGEEAFRGRRRP